MIPETIETLRELQRKENLNETTIALILLISQLAELKEILREKQNG